MADWCIKLKNKLERTFSMPFEVSLSVVDGEEQYTCYPTNSEEIFFTVKAYIHDQIRLVVEIAPQHNAEAILNDMACASESKKSIFFQYLDVLCKENAKVRFCVNGNEYITPNSEWPALWRFFNCRVVLLPIPEVNNEDEVIELLGNWIINGVSLVFSLLTIEESITNNDFTPQQEGNPKVIQSIKYERSRVNREICLAHKGYTCSVCGFNFLENYGLIGKDYIEVHHTTPVSEMGDNYSIDIDRDLVPVCSNCHSMIHRKTPPLTVDELKSIIFQNRNKTSNSGQSPLRKNAAKDQRLIPDGSMLVSIEPDTDERRLIHNMMELDGGTTIMQIVIECQRQFQEKYFSMKPNDWRHVIGDYVRNVTNLPKLKEEEVFRFKAAG
jgi:5-methylcytosine-specific restriction protein A